MARRLVLIALATAVLVAATAGSAGASLLAPSTACRGQTNTSLSWSEQERIMRCMHNYARSRAGLPGLRASGLLQDSSNGKTADMIRCKQYSHYACGRPLTYHFSRVGYLSCRTYGVAENIHYGPGEWGSVRTIMKGWLNSATHRHNILNSSYRDVGFGLRKGNFKGGAAFWTAHFGYRYC